MATYEYAYLLLTNENARPSFSPPTVRQTRGLRDRRPAGDYDLDDLTAVDALNALGAEGWRPLQRDDLTRPQDTYTTEAWHLVRSSDDHPRH